MEGMRITTTRHFLQFLYVYVLCLDSPVCAAGSSVPCHWQRRVFCSAHETEWRSVGSGV